MYRESFADVIDGRKNNLDFLRFVLAVLVVAYHCFPLLYRAGTQTSSIAQNVMEKAGAAAVPFFFVISGFLITRSWLHNPNFKIYLSKRILRIFPAFIAASIFGALIVGPLSTQNAANYWQHFNWPKFVVYLFLLPADVVGPDMSNVFSSLPFPNAINGSFWTLRYEFECYLLVALLGLAGLLKKKRWILVAFLVLFGLWSVQILTQFPIFPGREFPMLGNMQRWARLLTFFFTGMTFYLYRDKIPYSSKLFFISLAILIFSTISNAFYEIALPIFGSYCLLYFAFSSRIKLQNFGKYGDFSYGVYLYAFPIQQLLVYYFGARLNILSLFLYAFVLSLICAFFSWHLVERPFLRLKKGAPTLLAR